MVLQTEDIKYTHTAAHLAMGMIAAASAVKPPIDAPWLSNNSHLQALGLTKNIIR
jgi:hypothetical protein